MWKTVRCRGMLVNLLRVTMLPFMAVTLAGCGGAGADEPSAGPATDAGATAGARLPALSPTPVRLVTLAPGDVAAAERVVRRLVAAVNGDRYPLARSLMADPDRWWSLDDMKAIRSIELHRVHLVRVEGPDAVLLQTQLSRTPAPIAGGPEWPNFMLLERDGSGAPWRVAETATGP